MGKTLSSILNRYYQEAVGGIVQKTPSHLNRGEGTELEYYIFKIDLVGSTLFTWTKTHQTYLKLAHTFLSSVDEITREFGADGEQAEYAGDGLIAYFRSNVSPLLVMKAAYWCREAAFQMKTLDPTLNKFHFYTKIIVHFGKLLMAKIGPRGDSFASAIGPELHKACKMEERVTPGQGRVSIEFFNKLPVLERFRLLNPNYREIQVLKQQPSTLPTRALSPLQELFSQSAYSQWLRPLQNPLEYLQPQKEPSPEYETKKEIIDYSIKWDAISKFLI